MIGSPIVCDPAQIIDYPDPSAHGKRSSRQRVATGLTNVVLSSRPGELLKTRDVDALFMLTFKATEKHMGVYTVQGRETEQAAKGTYLLAFEQRHDAAHFASLLQAQGLNSPAPTRKSAEQLREFCGKATLRLAVMPAGSLPPTEEQLQEKREALERLLQESPDGPTPDDGPL